MKSDTPAALEQRSIGPILLAPGVRPVQVWLFITIVVAALCTVTFLPMMQALVFTEMLGVPKTEHGRLAGNLVTTQQCAVLLFIGLTGSLADWLGRRRVLAIALFGYAGCMFLYPLAGSVTLLFALQFTFGLMSTGHIAGSATFIADYPDNRSRGKFVSVNLLVQAVVSAVLVGWIGAQLPSWLVASGESVATAGRHAFWIVGALALAGAIATAAWLEDPPRTGGVSAPAVGAPARAALATFLDGLTRVVAHGRHNPRFGLIMLMGFVIRADYLVMLSFISLWVVNAAGDQGVATVDALKTAGWLMLTWKLATAVSQALFGIVVDRFDRSRLLVFTLLATGLTLISTLLVRDVFSLTMFIVVGAIGIAESALIVTGQSMLGQEAPADLRGAAMGVFYFSGTLGVVVMSATSGLVFDRIGYSAPFILVGALNLVFAALGVILILRSRRS